MPWQPSPALRAEPVHVLVVDDAPFIRKRVVELLFETGLVDPIDEAIDVQSAMRMIESTAPKVVILDIGLPGTLEVHNGIDVLRWIKRTNPQVHVVMLTNLSNLTYRAAAQRLGAFAFLDKSAESDQLPGIITTLAGLAPKQQTC